MPPKVEQRPVDVFFNQTNEVYGKNPAVAVIAIILTLFGLITFVWALPFPYLAFLGKYNGYLNWASFLIAAAIYYLLRLSPMVSYIMLFMLFGFSYGIIQLEGWQKSGGASLCIVGLSAFVIGTIIQMLTFRQKTASEYVNLLLKSPVWVIVFVLKKLNFKY